MKIFKTNSKKTFMILQIIYIVLLFFITWALIIQDINIIVKIVMLLGFFFTIVGLILIGIYYESNNI